MGIMKFMSLVLACALIVTVSGCGISKDKYDALLNEKVALEEKVALLMTAKDALKNEYDNILKEKMDLATKLEIVTNEKNALKDEYDKILDEKIAVRAAYDKLIADTRGTTQAAPAVKR